jgi:hypothetical protein
VNPCSVLALRPQLQNRHEMKFHSETGARAGDRACAFRSRAGRKIREGKTRCTGIAVGTKTNISDLLRSDGRLKQLDTKSPRENEKSAAK